MNKVFLFSVFGSALILSACDGSGLKQQLGLDRKSPDEFAVMQRAPLEMPSDLTKLPPPQPGMPRPQDTTAKQQAAKVILGDAGVVTNNALSSSEESLLQKTNATGVSPDIRRQLDEDAREEKSDKRPVIKRLLNVGDGDPSAVVVDAKAEAKRIQDAKAAGQPITTGDTPVIEE